MSAIPIPDPATEADAHFWRALRDGVLHVQRCAACGRIPAPTAPGLRAVRCAGLRRGRSWPVRAKSGRTRSCIRRRCPGFADRVPYGAVVVRLDEGVFLVSNLVDCPLDELAVGARVELAPTRVVAGPAAGDDVVLPLFRRVRPG